MKRQLIFIRDKKRGNYVDKTSEITSIQHVGRYINITFESPKIFHYRKENVVYYPLLKTRRRVRIYHNGELQPYDTLFDYGKYVKLGTRRQECSPALKKSEIEICKIHTPATSTKNILSYFRQLLQAVPETTVESPEEPLPESEETGNSIPEKLIQALDNIDLQDERTALFNYLNRRIRIHKIDTDRIVYPFGCNASQKLATQRALSSNISVIEGPPGTGKTQTILNIVANLLMQGKTVGIVSNNNEAVKNVREKFTKYGYGTLMAELGNRQNIQTFFETKQANFSPEQSWRLEKSAQSLANKRLGKLSAKIDESFRRQNELAELRTRLANTECEYRHLQEERPLAGERMQRLNRFFRRRFNSRRALLLRHFMTVKYSEYSQLSILRRVELLFRFGVLHQRQLFEWAGDLQDYADHQFYRMLIDELAGKIGRIERWLHKYDVCSLNDEYTHISACLFQDRLFRRYEEMGQIGTQTNFRASDYKHNFNKFIKRYPVLLSTTYSLHSSIGSGHVLDYVIVDESSQVNVITAAICCAYCRNIVVIGDSRQLPHIVDEKLTEYSNNLRTQYRVPEEYDYIHQNILTSLKRVFLKKLPVTLLREHYRCHPQIINFCNRRYYRGRLLIMSHSDDNHPFQVLTTTASKSYSNKGRIYNQRQIDVTCNWLRGESANPEHIGVISPYRYHAEVLREYLPAGIVADTIHKFQGREKDIIVFHTVRNQITKFLDNPNLINVAVSRAVRKLVVVKSSGMSIPHGSDIGDLLRYIRFTSDDYSATFIDSSIRSVFDILHTQYTILQQSSWLSKNKQSPAESIIDRLLHQLLSEQDKFAAIGYHKHYRLCELVGRNVSLSDEEWNFVHHGAHLDFLLYNRMDNSPILGIEVDGVIYHRFNEEQQVRDKKKNNILATIGLPLLRLSTDGSNEKERIICALEQAMQQG